MSYEAEISRNNSSAFLFLIDMSGSMTDPYGNGKRKADGVADAINKLLTNLSIKCTKSEGVRDYYDVGVISYGKRVEPAALGSNHTGNFTWMSARPPAPSSSFFVRSSTRAGWFATLLMVASAWPASSPPSAGWTCFP